MIKLNIPVKAMGAVRMTGRGKFVNKSALRYLSYKQEFQWHVKNQYKKKPLEGALWVEVIFHMQIPESWSNKRRNESVGEYHTKKPDADNLVKGVFDSLNKLVWQDDNQVAEMVVRKVYSENPRVEIFVKEVA